MKPLLFLAFLALSGCAASPSAPHARMASALSDGGPQWLTGLPAVTGNSATIVLYDSTVTHGPVPQRFMVTAFVDHAITILYRTQAIGSTTWRTLNGGGSGDTVAASTPFVTDYFVLGPYSQLEAVTGSTGPTVSEVGVGVVFERTLGM